MGRLVNRDLYDFFSLTFGRSISFVLILINTALIGRILGPQGFGQWSMIVAAATLMHSILLNWTHAANLRFGCEEWTRSKSLSMTYSARIPLILSGFLLSIILLKIQPMDWLYRFFSVDKNFWWVVLFYTGSIWLTFEARTTLQATGNINKIAVNMPIVSSISSGFLLTLYVMSQSGSRDLLLIVIGLAVISGIVWGSALIRVLIYGIPKWRWPTFQGVMQHVRFAWPLLPTFVVGYVSDWGDHIILQSYSSIYELGLFSSSYQAMLGLLTLSGALTTIILPRLIAKNAETEEAASFYLENVIPTMFCLWSLFIIGIITVLPTVFILIMGEPFRNSLPILLMLCVTIPTSVIGALYSPLFNLQQRLQVSFIYSTLMALINVGISIFLIPRIGVIGAAIGTIVSYGIGHLLYLFDQHYYVGVPFLKMSILFALNVFIGVGQVVMGPELLFRIPWLVVSMILLFIVFRQFKIINPDLLYVIFSGRLYPIGLFLSRALVPNTSKSTKC